MCLKDAEVLDIFMSPNSKLRGHIGLGPFVRLPVCPSVRLSVCPLPILLVVKLENR